MKIRIVAYHLPEVEGTATGRVLRGFVDGLIANGEDVQVWSWRYEPPEEELPSWCDWRPLPYDTWVRMKVRALARPRRDVARRRWVFPEDAVAVADNLMSFPAVAAEACSVMQFHYLTRFDAPVLGWSPRDVQHMRAERRAAKRSRLLLAYSGRVADSLRRPDAVPVPVAYPMPEARLPLVEEPVAAMLADWRWPPNHVALERLLGAWGTVRARVPGARLLLAGRHLDRVSIGSAPGVEAVGPVAYASDVLSRAAALAFPCPPTSGPKIKVLEALAHGVPVVTTSYGVEGLHVSDGRDVAVASEETFADTLGAVLADPERRARMAACGREAVIAHHGPEEAARVRIDLFRRAFPALA